MRFPRFTGRCRDDKALEDAIITRQLAGRSSPPGAPPLGG
jgi:hypothetical protein